VRGVDTDDEEGDDREMKDTPDFSQEEETDWNSDGMGGTSVNWRARRDVVNNAKTEELADRFEVDSGFRIGEKEEEEEEDVKPKIEGLNATATSVKTERLDPEVIDLLEEPDTEPSDFETPAFFPSTSSSRPIDSHLDSKQHIKAEKGADEWAQEIKRQEEVLKRRNDSQSQSQSQSQSRSQRFDPRSQLSSQPILVDGDEDFDEEEEAVDEQTLRMLKQQAAKAKANEQRKVKQARRDNKKKGEESLEVVQVKTEVEESSRAKREEEKVDAEMNDAEDDDFEEEPAAWELEKVEIDTKVRCIPA
jgi:hypothetical protein